MWWKRARALLKVGSSVGASAWLPSKTAKEQTQLRRERAAKLQEQAQQ
jgi:hypothetical protein